ncbi:uncharacterized protein LOC129317669 isoform X2 [Prosopis cineraria]|nr:uncharacterized protein LOC129317669 isoform X2 [Prosopis cineraria]
MMNHSWIDALRASDEYEMGVDHFLEFAKNNVLSNKGLFYCPCVKRLNGLRQSPVEIKDHLICFGLYKAYRQWVLHSESRKRGMPQVENDDMNFGDQIEDILCDMLLYFFTTNFIYLICFRKNMENLVTDKSSSKRGKRGTTRLTKLAQIHEKIQLNFDDKGQPIDKKKGNIFKSFVGLVACQKISILEEKWDDVNESDRNDVWESILITYDIKETLFLKDKWLKYAMDRWRDFKSKLIRKYVFPKSCNENDNSDNDVNMEKPWEKYPFIDYDMWMKFVHSRHDPKFL